MHRGPAGEDWILSFKAWRTRLESWLSHSTSPTVTKRAFSNANRYRSMFSLWHIFVGLNFMCVALKRPENHIFQKKWFPTSLSPFIPPLFACSVSRLAGGKEGSAGVSTGSAPKSSASTQPAETCSAKTSTTAATATNESLRGHTYWAPFFLKPANQASTLYDCQKGKYGTNAYIYVVRCDGLQ